MTTSGNKPMHAYDRRCSCIWLRGVRNKKDINV
jgi:hypothetical protein